MSPSPAYTLSRVHAAIITTSDRVLSGEKPDKAAPQCQRRLAEAGVTEVRTTVVPEARQNLDEALRNALTRGERLVIVLGGSGLGAGNEAPEAVRATIDVEIPGIAEQIRAHGLEHTALSPLSREVAGITERSPRGALVVASPGSLGGANDTLDVLIPLLAPIFAQLG